jgi:hypothetical protein
MMEPPPVGAAAAPGPRRLRALGELALFLLPTAALLALGGPCRVLEFNALSTHDGFHSFGVSLDPLGTTPYCAQTFRYARMVFPAAVFAAAAVVAGTLRLVGLGEWLHGRFVYAGHDLPHYVLVHAFVYHGVLLLVCWVSARQLGAFLGSRRAAFLVVGVLLQPAVFRGLLTPLDLLFVALGLRAVRAWCDGAPTWRAAAGTGGLLALSLLTRELFLALIPVFLACHLTAHGRRHAAKAGAVVLLAALPPALLYAAVSAAQGVNLFAKVVEFIAVNSTALPFEAFPPFVLAGGVSGTVLTLAVAYAVVALARAVRGEWGRFGECRRLSAEGLWNVCVLVTFLRAGAFVLDTPGNYGRLLALAPVALRDFAALTAFLAARLGRAFDVGLVVVAASLLGLLVYYQHARYPAHLAGLERSSGFLEAGWVSKINGATPWPYR